MAIMRTARRRVTRDSEADYLRGLQAAVNSLRHFAEIEGNPDGHRTLLHAANVIEEIHVKWRLAR
jgi:hypothetical protein